MVKLKEFLNKLKKSFKLALENLKKNKVSKWFIDRPYLLTILIALLLALQWHWLLWGYLVYFVAVSVYLAVLKTKSKALFNRMNKFSCLICGQKGAGKDLLTQAYINYSKPYYYSNISYGHNYHAFNFKDIDLSPNDYEHLIDGKIEQVPYNLKWGSQLILSDGGIYLPSQCDTYLSRKYKTMPVYFALSRHLSDTNIIVNVQNYERLWKKLREQFDNYILCKKSTPKGLLKLLKWCPLLANKIFITCYYYDNLQSFEQKKLPFLQSGLLSRNNALYSTTADTMRKVYEYENGTIRKFVVPIKLKHISYDTHYFRQLLVKEG